ncbi:MAG: Alkaline phosphatase synthesis sensor protein PhoR [candidate division WS6 bacterium OLB20]|uniref:histidine kinase n=1 Tax=candidate division WS6 bacterium OLB20 TaxID=1617426 RepID=A0A136LYN3_9BACT|nr:MAG: Alkaline phosphatase synthesis sensor protein PhoR [candidate division WS6 bacterium OLB20]
MIFGNRKKKPAGTPARKLLDANLLASQLDAVQAVSSVLIKQTDLDETLSVIVNQLGEKLHYINPVIYLLNDSRSSISVRKVNVPKAIVALTNRIVGKSVYDVNFDLDSNNTLAKAIRSSEIQISDDFSEVFHPYLNSFAAKTIQTALNIKRVIISPIKVDDVPIGCLSIGSRSDEVESSEITTLQTFSAQISIAIYNSQQFENIAQQKNNLESLFNLTSSISQTLDPNKVTQTAVNTIPMNDELVGITVSTYDPDTKLIVPQATTQGDLARRAEEVIGSFKQYALDLSNPDHRSNMIVQTIKDGTPKESDHLSSVVSPVMPKALVDGLNRLLKINKVIAYPLQSRGEPIGVIVFYMRLKEENAFTPEKQQLFETYASQISIALENALLYTQSEEITQNLREARRRERDMVDVMGHELRTPISIVRNALLTLEKDYQEDNKVEDQEKLGKYLSMAIESTKREVRLIETMLSATKVEGNKIQLDFGKVDMLDVIDDAIEALKPLADDKNLPIVYARPQVDYFAYADRVRTQEIMDNILSNGIKYTASGEVRISIRKDKGKIWVDVSDTGIGLHEEDKAQLGKKFFRAKAMFSDKPGVVQPSGTGLGLFVTFNLIELMNGDKTIKSEPGNGSVFSFGLPEFTGQKEQHLQEAMLGKTSKPADARSD